MARKYSKKTTYRGRKKSTGRSRPKVTKRKPKTISKAKIAQYIQLVETKRQDDEE